ncbi:hypothetical protein SAMN05444673_2600 [Bacillus sp. OV166]|uniref:hypothetical protein n=1 Tax=Bacillus sp. OV166 TaxID=1882763 RepID=UPI000A2AC3DB|nr:hypothetical protein [Bacillus sp. OV166]SMQ75987.1 hypothetical protein SAMN05444673_2600 [Bacillus sp. OV166]
MSETSIKIKDLCEKWRNSVKYEDGSVSYTLEGEKYRLLTTGIQFHEFDFEDTQTACKELTSIRAESLDHSYFRAWVAELIFSEFEYFSENEMGLQQLFSACVRASLTGKASYKINFEEAKSFNKSVDFNTIDLARHSSLIFSQLSFPLLEGVLKKSCKEYVDSSGKVLKNFTVPKHIHPKEVFRVNDPVRVSSLKVLLYLLHAKISNLDLHIQLTEMFQIIEKTWNVNNALNTIYKWRNSSLHGTDIYHSIGSTVFNLVTIIALDGIKGKFETAIPYIRQKIDRRVSSRLNDTSDSYQRANWEFYPPF